MPGIDPAVLLAIGTVATGAVTGIIAFLRSSGDRDSVQVATSKEVVEMVREQLGDMDKRLNAVEATVSAWETWANIALAALDRAVALLDAEHRVLMAASVEQVRATQPTRAGRPRPGG